MPNTTTIYEWNSLDQPLTQLEWKSKTFVTKKPVNLGAARVVADYPTAGNVAINWENVTDCWAVVQDNIIEKISPEFVPEFPSNPARSGGFVVEEDGNVIFIYTIVDNPYEWDGESIDVDLYMYGAAGTELNSDSTTINTNETLVAGYAKAYAFRNFYEVPLYATGQYFTPGLYSTVIPEIFTTDDTFSPHATLGPVDSETIYVYAITDPEDYEGDLVYGRYLKGYAVPESYSNITADYSIDANSYDLFGFFYVTIDIAESTIWVIGLADYGDIKAIAFDLTLNYVKTLTITGWNIDSFIVVNNIAVLHDFTDFPNGTAYVHNFAASDGTTLNLISDAIYSVATKPISGEADYRVTFGQYPVSGIPLESNKFFYLQGNLYEFFFDALEPSGLPPATTLSWNALSGLTFKLWVDKQLVMTKNVINSRTFRMPTGYKSDTFEVSVEGDVRVRSIHLAETPTSLEDA